MGYENVRIALDHALEVVTRHSLSSVIRELPWLSTIVGVPVLAKLEFTQATGSFKIRGAFNALTLSRSSTAIAASAGNHALAIAHAGRVLGRDYRICLPTTASNLKKEKLSSLGAQLVFHGDSLDHAIDYASALAASLGWDFISPFDDPRVIAGASTVLVESVKQAPEVSTVIIPTGGGGLLSGCVLAEQYLGREYDLVAVEPELHATFGGGLAIPTAPTLADGLAVMPRADSSTFRIVRQRSPRFETVAEEELAAATLAFLNQESWLVEPSGAAGLAVLVRMARQQKLKGSVLLLLTGGNIAKSTIAKLFSVEVHDRELAELAGVRPTRTASARTSSNVDYSASVLQQRSVDEAVQSAPVDSAVKLISNDVVRRAVSLLDQIADFNRYTDKRGLAVPSSAVALVSELARKAVVAAQEIRDGDASGKLSAGVCLDLRALNSIIAQLSHSLEWRSPAYEQAQVAEFFRLAAQGSALVNYDRYGHPAVRELEEQLRQVMGVTNPDIGCIATSSGMAAHTLIESWLLRDRIRVGAKVAIAPYIYFEVSEQLSALSCVEVTRLETHDPTEIAVTVVRDGYDVLYVDPLANNADSRAVDIPLLLDRLYVTAAKKVTVVIDGTMLPGLLPPLIFNSQAINETVCVIYYESASKYLQLGLEHCLAGLVLHNNRDRAVLEKYRRNTGTILYPNAAAGFPRYTRHFLIAHMRKLSHAALTVATLIKADSICSRHFAVVFPGLSSHPDYPYLCGLDYHGGCITFGLRSVGLNSSDLLNGFIEKVLERARAQKIPITKGVSFGFNHIRISAASAIAESEWPFLRLYVSALDEAECKAIAYAFSEACKMLEEADILQVGRAHA